MKKIILSILILATLTIMACTQRYSEPDYVYDQNMINSVETRRVGDTILYDISVNKPTPCHQITHTARMSGTETLEILINLVDSGEPCAQVIDIETLSGSIQVLSQPNQVVVQVD